MADFGALIQSIFAGPRTDAQPGMEQQPMDQPPPIGKGRLIAAILADALRGAAGQGAEFGPMIGRQRDEQVNWGRRRQAEIEDYITKKRLDQQYPDLSPMERDAQAWAHMTQSERDAYLESQKAHAGDPDVFLTLPNGSFYSGPRSGIASAMMGYSAPQRPAVGDIVPDPRKPGGPTPPASGGFRY